MMTFFRHLFSPSPSIENIKAENYFSREWLSIPPAPSSPEVDAIYQAIREDLKVLPEGYRHSDVIIELTGPARDAIVRLQEDIDFYHASFFGTPFAPAIDRERFRLYGIEVRVVDQLSEGRSARVLYIHTPK